MFGVWPVLNHIFVLSFSRVEHKQVWFSAYLSLLARVNTHGATQHLIDQLIVFYWSGCALGLLTDP